MKIIESHIVIPQKEASRLSDYAVGIFASIPSRAGVKKALKKGLILVNQKRGVSGQFITGNERIDLLEDENQLKKNIDLKLDVLWEDNYLAVIYKPAGLLVSGNKAKTVSNALSFNLSQSTCTDAVQPQPVHRLDFATSGLLLIGKTASALHELGKLFETKNIQKNYIAVTIGQMPSEGVMNIPIENKESFSSYKVLKSIPSERFDFLNLVLLTPKTGRRHQLRIHCSKIGNPILGDATYGTTTKILKGKGLYLHAKSLIFKHPITKQELCIEKEVPNKFNYIFKQNIKPS